MSRVCALEFIRPFETSDGWRSVLLWKSYLISLSHCFFLCKNGKNNTSCVLSRNFPIKYHLSFLFLPLPLFVHPLPNLPPFIKTKRKSSCTGVKFTRQIAGQMYIEILKNQFLWMVRLYIQPKGFQQDNEELPNALNSSGESGGTNGILLSEQHFSIEIPREPHM